ncbi:MAG: glycine cleavage system protein R [Caulobacteraceae bacterium]
MTLLVLSVVGSDRPGLTRALSAAVLSAGGNWLESRLSRLGGLYVGSVLVELAAGGEEALRAAVRAVDAEGLEVRVAPAVEEADGGEGEALKLSLVGQDRTGIVSQVTAVLSALGANIETFETWVRPEAWSGAPLFHAEARVRLPADLAATKVQAALQDISAEIMVDISVSSAA